jgi:hypothetical protein
MIVVYVAHQYGGDPANRAAAAKWCAFFSSLGYSPSAMWIVLTGEWDESMREQGLRIDFENIERSDVMVLVGPTISSGMECEARHALDEGVPIVDLVNGFSDTPDDLSAVQTLSIVARINTVVNVTV